MTSCTSSRTTRPGAESVRAALGRITLARARAAGAPPPDHAPDALAVALFVTSEDHDQWGERYMLLRRMSAKMPHLRGRRLASYDGAALALDRKKATYHAWRDCRAVRIMGARIMRRGSNGPAIPSAYDPEVLAAAWDSLDAPLRTTALALAHGAHRVVRGRLADPSRTDGAARAMATRDAAAIRRAMSVAIDGPGRGGWGGWGG